MIDGNFIEKWQELIGAALGPFLAIFLSLIGFWLKTKYENRKRRRREIVEVEVSLTQSLNDVYNRREELRAFINRLDTIVESTNAISDPNIFSIENTNFPHIGDIFISSRLSAIRLRSYYIHNKLLMIDAILRNLNHKFIQLKDNFAEIWDRNKFLLGTGRVNPPQQRSTYSQNLTAFSTEMKKLVGFIDGHIKLIVQAKVYNLKLMKERFTRWKYEGVDLKYFKDKRAIIKYNEDLDCLKRIDDLIEKEVNTNITEADTLLKQT